MIENKQMIREFVNLFSNLPKLDNAKNLYDKSTHEGSIRAQNLELYLNIMISKNPKILLIGEAPGYQGTSRTGVPFGSEFIITNNMPEVPFFRDNPDFKLANPSNKLWREPTSTIMWRTISKYSNLPVLWAAFPHHPHKPNNSLTNRPPTSKEIRESRFILEHFLKLFPKIRLYAVGNVAHGTLKEMGLDVDKLRHPSHGGAKIFAQQLSKIIEV